MIGCYLINTTLHIFYYFTIRIYNSIWQEKHLQMKRRKKPRWKGIFFKETMVKLLELVFDLIPVTNSWFLCNCVFPFMTNSILSSLFVVQRTVLLVELYCCFNKGISFKPIQRCSNWWGFDVMLLACYS